MSETEQFPFCEDSVGLVIIFYYPAGGRDVYFCERDEIDVIEFLETKYFRLNQPCYRISIHADKFRVYKKEVKRGCRTAKIVEGCETLNQCLWLEAERCEFIESMEFPEWVQKSREEAQNEVKEEEERQYKKAEEELEQIQQKEKEKQEKSFFKKLFKK